MITTGVVLFLIGILIGASLLTTLGSILAVVGVALAVLSATTDALRGRRFY